jgi:hypothetical protein
VVEKSDQCGEVEVTLKEDLTTLIGELDRYHDSSHVEHHAVMTESGMPDFVTAENGLERNFTTKGKKALAYVARTLYDGHPGAFSVLEFDPFINIVRQCVANLHASGEFEKFCNGGADDGAKKLFESIQSKVALLSNEFTHYFPSWTLGMEREAPFVLGPVSFFTRLQWLDAVDFSKEFKDRYANDGDANHQWKAFVREALTHPKLKTPLPALAGAVYKTICDCPSVLGVTIKGYEQGLSRKHARLVCKTALDAVSILFGGAEYFHQQALSDERLEPVGSDQLMASNGFLWLPGMLMGKRIPHAPYAKLMEHLESCTDALDVLASIVSGLVDPKSHSHPKLVQRWAMALDWFGEGQREQNDAIALAKLGTSLDVLSCVGKFKFISEMVSHLLGVDLDKEVVDSRPPKTLRKVVKEIYDDGRSRILHGSHSKRLKSFVSERQNAAFLGRMCLMQCALRLKAYSGPDSDTAFRDMPARTA